MKATCEDHGHYCPICEREQQEQEHRDALDKAVSSWSWDRSSTECAQHIIQEDWDIDEIEAAMKRQDFSRDDIESVIDAHIALA